MSDTMGAEGTTPEVPAVPAGPEGATEGAAGTEGSPPVVASDEPTFTVEIDGKEETLTRSQIAEGFLRQSDYTRKTQEIAESKRRLETLDRFEKSLDSDPTLTLQQLADAYGVELTPAEKAAVEVAESALDPDDPVSQEIAELREWKKTVEAQFTQRQEAEVQAQIDADLDAVKTKFNVPDADWDELALLEFAVENNIADLSNAHRLMQSIKAETPPKTPKTPTVPVEGGSSRTPPQSGGSSKPTLDQAFDAAAKSLGFR